MNSNKKINDFISKIENKWKKIKTKDSSIKKVIFFILGALDESINFVESYLENGEEKKEVVLYVMATLFDNIILKSFPFYILPFTNLIRVFLIKIVFSVVIDFIVEKYNQNIWSWKRKESYE
jgi:hypothetical protein